jgi:O-antigen/teichoic acid export membrane protein
VFLRNIAIFTAVDIAGLGIGLITSPITTRLLTIEQYGTLPLLGAVWSIFTIIQFAGMDTAYLFYRARGIHDNGVLVATSTLVASATAALIWGLFCIVSITTPWLSDYAGVTRVELVAFLISILPSALVAWHLQLLRLMHQAAAFAQVTIIGRIAAALVAIPVMYFLPQEDRLTGSILTHAVLALLSYMLAVRLVKSCGVDPHSRQNYSRSLVKPMVALGFAFIPGALIYALFAVIDRLILGWYVSNAEVAVFVLAASVAGVALILKAAFSRTWDPHTVTWIGTRDERVYLPRLQAAADLIAPLVAIATVLALVWGDTIFELIFPAAYAGSGRVMPVLVLSGTLATLSLVANLTELISGRARYRLPVYSIGLAVNIAICIGFIPRYGAYGAALGALAGEITILALWIGLGRWLLGNLRVDWRFSGLAISLSLLMCAAYRPGILLPGPILFEQMLATALCAAAAWALMHYAVRRFETFAGTNG